MRSAKKAEVTYLTRQELADRWRISPFTVDDWTRKGKIKSVQFGKKHIYELGYICRLEEEKLRRSK